MTLRELGRDKVCERSVKVFYFCAILGEVDQMIDGPLWRGNRSEFDSLSYCAFSQYSRNIAQCLEERTNAAQMKPSVVARLECSEYEH